MRGRPPVPTVIKELRGTNRADRGVTNEAKPPIPDFLPKPPTFMKSRWAKKIWRTYGRLLLDSGLLTDLDTVAFQMFCQAYGRWVEAEVALSKEDLVLTSHNGNNYKNPRLTVAKEAWNELKRMLPEFGFSPSERTRIAALIDEDEDDLAKLLFRDVNKPA